jgi:hypothetical protein
LVRYLKLYNWSGIDKTLEQKPNIFLSQFALIAIIACVIQIFNDALLSNFKAVGLDLVLLIVFLTSFLLNERRKHMAAKLVFIIFATSFIFVYAAIIPKEMAVYFFFFPILTIIFLVFSNEQKRYKYGAIAYSIVMMAILEITNYHPFGDIDILEGNVEDSSYYVNLAISIFVMIFSMYNIDVINIKIEKIRMEAEKELKQKNIDLKQANEELDHFVYSASHDLKAPLSSILGLINIAKYEVKDENVMDYFVRIEERVARLTKFIKEVIEISRNSRTTIEKTEVDLVDLINEIIENNNYMDLSNGIEIKRDIDLNGNVKIDKSRLEVILNNLVSNAIRYQNPEIKNPQVIISLKSANGNLEITISDNGLGIPEAQHEKIFEMFFRGEQSKEGSGLGLYIVKSMIQKIDGKLEMKSKEGQGTEMKVIIPID